MAVQDVALEIAQHEPFVPAKRASALALAGLSVSALVHGIAIFALLQLEPAQAVDSGAQEIPVEIVVEASGSEPAAVQAPPPAHAEPAEVEPPPISTLTTAENEPPPAPPEIAAVEPPLPPAAQAASSEPEPPPPPGVDPVQPVDAVAKPVAPPEPTAPALSAPPEPIAVAPPIEPAQAEPQRQGEHSDDVAERRRQEELQPHAREAEAKKKEEAAARKQADAKKREEMRAAAQAAMAHDREAALERFAHAPALSHLAPAPGSDLVDYHSAVLRHLAAFRHYPESARERGAHGQTVVTFTLDNAGRVVSASISRSSGQADIDAETLAMVRRAQPFPAPPPAAQRSFSAAIEFHLE